MKKTLSLTALFLVITVCAGNDVESEFTLFLNSAYESFLKSKPFEICVNFLNRQAATSASKL